jgi:predicted ATPase
VRESVAQTLRDSLVGALRDRRLLVVLDNVEQVVSAAPVLGELLAACAGLTILATSRQPLRLRAEREYPVAPLALPDLDRLPVTADLARIPAVDLFVRRAEAARRTFALTAENARTVAEIAVRLDGLPLAIELAAARTKILSPSDLLARLEHRLPLLTGGAQDLPARQQTLRATLDWSYDLLIPHEQSLFRRFSVFAGGFTLEAAEAVSRESGVGSRESINPSAPDSVLEGIASLVDKNLLRVMDQDDDSRFGLLETMREYGIEALAKAGEEETVRSRHAAWYLALAERAEPELWSADQDRWYRLIEEEIANLRAAIGWAIVRRDAGTAMRIAGALTRFWFTRGLVSEARQWLHQALDLDAAEPSPARGRALADAASVAFFQGDYEGTIVTAEEAAALCRAAGDQTGLAIALGSLAHVLGAKGDHEQATRLFEEALELYGLLGNRGKAAGAINNLGLVAWRSGDHERAEALHEQALALRRELGDRIGIAQSLSNLGLVVADRHDHPRAARLQQDALALHAGLGNKRGLADSFENVALNDADMGEDERAAVLFAVAAELRARIGIPSNPSDLQYNQRRIDGLRQRLGEAAFAKAAEVGRTMTLDEAIAFALDRERAAPADDFHTAPRADGPMGAVAT